MTRPVSIVRVLLVFACLLCCARQGLSQPIDPLAGAKLSLAHAYQDNGKCVSCHERGVQGSDFLGDSATGVWQEYDKHRDAFRLLYQGQDASDVAGAKEKQVLVRRILGFELREAFADEALTSLSKDPQQQAKVSVVRNCLNCHATWPQVSGGEHPPVPLDLGVSCQACHGPGLKWTEPHTYAWWRLVTPAGKESLGFHDVRDPAARARICASCHVGNVAEGKFVTHAWYAAGHPPLPSFEYATFAAQMPVHWRPLAEKMQFAGKEANPPLSDLGVEQRAKLREFLNIDVPEQDVRASYREANFPAEQFGHDPFEDLPRLKETVVSGVVVLEMYAKLVKEQAVAAQAEGPAKAGTPAAWPEFAIYDCASCHHELRSGPGYPQRPFGKHPIGRPPAQLWPMMLAKLGVLQSVQYDPAAGAEPLAKMNQAQKDFEQAITATVFGKPVEVAEAAKKLEAELTVLSERLKYCRYDRAATHSALLLLTDSSQVETRDYHSARQIAWAVREIVKDYQGLPYWPVAAQEYTSIERLFDWPLNPNEIPTDALVLTLPATREQSIVKHLKMTLPAIRNYDSAAFAERLELLHARFSDQTLPPQRPGSE